MIKARHRYCFLNILKIFRIHQFNHGDYRTMHRTIDNFDLIGLMIAFLSLIRVAMG
jgi:hypothetical protein